MTPTLLNNILLQWTGHSNLEAIETKELAQWVEKHPYSPSLQFLLAKKYDMANSPLLLAQLKKTASFFPPLYKFINGLNWRILILFQPLWRKS